jgi:hypothetical protein
LKLLPPNPGGKNSIGTIYSDMQKYYDVLLLIPTRNSTVWNSRGKLQMTQEMGKIMQNTHYWNSFPFQNLKLSASATGAYS